MGFQRIESLYNRLKRNRYNNSYSSKLADLLPCYYTRWGIYFAKAIKFIYLPDYPIFTSLLLHPTKKVADLARSNIIDQGFEIYDDYISNGIVKLPISSIPQDVDVLYQNKSRPRKNPVAITKNEDLLKKDNESIPSFEGLDDNTIAVKLQELKKAPLSIDEWLTRTEFGKYYTYISNVPGFDKETHKVQKKGSARADFLKLIYENQKEYPIVIDYNTLEMKNLIPSVDIVCKDGYRDYLRGYQAYFRGKFCFTFKVYDEERELIVYFPPKIRIK